VGNHGRMVDDRTVRTAIDQPLPRTRSPIDDDQPQSADQRDRSAADRDAIAATRDQVAAIRDKEAELRDLDAEARDRFGGTPSPAAGSDRHDASRDRDAGARDRDHSAGDRQAAATDRALSAQDRDASIDTLTGAYRRDHGMLELERETARANRTPQPLVLAFVDVDGLKATNDTQGHTAGDQLLRRTVDTMRDHFRPYDIIVRFGGDEFLCALPGLDITSASERFALIATSLAAQPHTSISVGLADYRSHDSLDNLIDRADTALRAQRARTRPAPH
jgi:diguanylate cyclase (GGDEF)-like protein